MFRSRPRPADPPIVTKVEPQTPPINVTPPTDPDAARWSVQTKVNQSLLDSLGNLVEHIKRCNTKIGQLAVQLDAQRQVQGGLIVRIDRLEAENGSLRDTVTHLDQQLKGHVGKQVEYLTSELQTFRTSFNQQLNGQARDHHLLRDMVDQLCGDVASLHEQASSSDMIPRTIDVVTAAESDATPDYAAPWPAVCFLDGGCDDNVECANLHQCPYLEVRP